MNFGKLHSLRTKAGFLMTQRFIGRTKELAALQATFDQPGFQMAVVYGRRRLGKTTLLNKFIDNNSCKSISFMATEEREQILLESMSNAVLDALAPDMRDSVRFDSFEKLFDYIAQAAKKERIIFMIDEYSYLAKECDYMNSLLQKCVDQTWKNSQLYLILCGSLVGFMRDEVLSERAPLYGRSSVSFKLQSLSYRESAQFVPNYNNEDKAIVFGVTGGVPKYLEQFNPDLSLDQNIMAQFFSNIGYFSDELIKTSIAGERQNPSAYNAIISAVASGHTKYNEIATTAGMKEISYYLNALVSADIFERHEGRRPFYTISDSMLRFWFSYVSRGASLINAGQGAAYYRNIVKPRLHEYMGPIFEGMAKQFLFDNMESKAFPYFVTSIEQYQDSIKDAGEVKQIEIDLLGKCENELIFAGECKFRNQKFSQQDLKDLEDKVKYLPTQHLPLVLFSLKGYAQGVAAERDKVLLFTIDDLYR